MITQKITRRYAKGKPTQFNEYDHYIALDWSCKVMAIGRLTKQKKHPTLIEQPADIKELKLYLRSLQGRKILTIEETSTAHWLYLELRDGVDRIIVCDPYRNRLLSDGPKTDKIDAAKLCLLLRAGLLKEVFHRDDNLYMLRRLVSAYEDLVQAGVRSLNQNSALARVLGPGHNGRRDTTIPFIAQYVDKQIDLYRESKAAYEKRIGALCRRNKYLKRLLAVDGIGPIGAVKILATVIDARRFSTAGHYLSYCGLVKLEKISGKRSYGYRTPRYSRRLKSVYKTAASSALTYDNPFHEYYDYLLSKGTAEHNARNNVARYIAKVTYGMLKHGTPYRPYIWRQTETKDKP
jgi:transposase